MNIQALAPNSQIGSDTYSKTQPAAGAKLETRTAAQPEGELREAFQDFVGQTFFSEMLKALRSTQQQSAYFHGGRAEEIFQGQLDQVLTEELSESSSERIADPMFELFQMGRPL